ncbi:MAG: hypothetical protein AAF629_19660 [Chloroflexota bacterium]
MYPIALQTQQLDITQQLNIAIDGIVANCKPSLPRQPYERELQNLAVKVLPEVKRRWPGKDDDHQRQENLAYRLIDEAYITVFDDFARWAKKAPRGLYQQLMIVVWDDVDPFENRDGIPHQKFVDLFTWFDEETCVLLGPHLHLPYSYFFQAAQALAQGRNS